MRTIITRSDDCGSSRAANQAIARAVDAGFIRNVSIMAPGPYVEEAAELLSGRKDVCFGLHVTFNAEWDKVKWGPVSRKDQVPTLVDTHGFFYQDPVMFQEHPPSIDEMLLECEAQLDKLIRAGFTISYVDTHMVPERYIPGWQEQLDRWIASKGLVNHNFFYNVIPDNDALAQTPGMFERVLAGLGDGQYFFLSHPAAYSQEMTECGNADVDGEELARNRNREASFVAAPDTKAVCERYGFRTIRYDEAVPIPDLNFKW